MGEGVKVKGSEERERMINEGKGGKEAKQWKQGHEKRKMDIEKSERRC